MSRRRRKSRERKQHKSQKPIVIVCVEGQTEKNYIRFLNSIYGTRHRIYYEIKPKLKESLNEYIQLISNKYEVDFEEVIFVYDLENSSEEYKKFITDNRLKHDNTYLLQPCIEYHFLLHHNEFKDSTNKYRDTREVEKELKSHLPNYKKGESFIWNNHLNKDEVELAKSRANTGFKNFNQKSFSMIGKFIEDHFIKT